MLDCRSPELRRAAAERENARLQNTLVFVDFFTSRACTVCSPGRQQREKNTPSRLALLEVGLKALFAQLLAPPSAKAMYLVHTSQVTPM